MAHRIERGRGRRAIANAELMQENVELRQNMHQLEAIMAAMEARAKRDPEAGGISEEEEVAGAEATAEPAEARMSRSILGFVTKAKLEVSNYTNSMNPEELIVWIMEVDRFFEYEEMDEEKKVKFTVTKLKGHATLW